MKRLSTILAAASAITISASPANAAEIFFTDSRGKVGVYDTDTANFANVANLSSMFGISQVIGLALDNATNTLYALDRSARNVYAIDAGTGSMSLAFSSSPITFQGGAFKGGTLFGIDENGQTLEGYDAGTGANLGILGDDIDHSHALGINAATGQLLVARGNEVFAIADDGTLGTSLGTLTGTGFAEDIDWLDGDIAYVSFGNTINLGSDGSVIFDASGNGFGSLSGVAVRQALGMAPVPEPSTWLMLILGFGLIGGVMRRKPAVKTSVSYS